MSGPRSDNPGRLKVFLCHSSEDKPTVRALCERLRSSRVDPWLDDEQLLPGQDWEYHIRHALRATDAVVICLSRKSVSKRGFVQREIRTALDIADEQPEGVIFMIPVRLEECPVPERLQRWHWVNYFDADGYGRLIKGLQQRAREIGIISLPEVIAARPSLGVDSGQGQLPYPKMSNAAADDMAATYAFYHGQKYIIDKLIKRFPALTPDLDLAQASFDARFKASVDTIDMILNKENTQRICLASTLCSRRFLVAPSLLRIPR